MCIALPMRVLECDGTRGLCEGQGERRSVDMSLVGPQPRDTWVLVFLDSAREVISAERAREVSLALTALSRVMEGDGRADIAALFPDLAGREPELPAFLRDQAKPAEGQG